MPHNPEPLTLDQWDRRYAELRAAGLCEPGYGGPLRRHVDDGDLRLLRLRMDNSPAALRLWNFLLTEEDRLHQAQAEGKRIVGTIKDLGTVPVMAYSLDNVVAFYPDGAWWIPCIMQRSTRLLEIADSLGIDDSFCPVRAMLGAFVGEGHFPMPGLLTCSVGAVCDDVSAIAQRLAGHGFPRPLVGSAAPPRAGARRGGGRSARRIHAPRGRRWTSSRRSSSAIRHGPGSSLPASRLTDAAACAWHRPGEPRPPRCWPSCGELCFRAAACPLPALEHADRRDAGHSFLLRPGGDGGRAGRACWRKCAAGWPSGVGVLPAEAVRVFWVNPVADLLAMNLLEDAGGRICGTEYLFCHALTCDSRGPAADGGPGPDGAGRSDGRPVGRSGGLRVPRDPPLRRRGGRRLAHSRGEPLRAWKGPSLPRRCDAGSAFPCWKSRCRRSATPSSRRCERGWKRLWKRRHAGGANDDLCRNRCRIANDEGRAAGRRPARAAGRRGRATRASSRTPWPCNCWIGLLTERGLRRGGRRPASSPRATAAS